MSEKTIKDTTPLTDQEREKLAQKQGRKVLKKIANSSEKEISSVEEYCFWKCNK